MFDHIEYITCGCASHAIQLIFDDDPEDDKTVYLSLMESGFNRDNRLSWKDRIRHAWQVLWHGRPFPDSIILKEKEVLRLVCILNKMFGVSSIERDFPSELKNKLNKASYLHLREISDEIGFLSNVKQDGDEDNETPGMIEGIVLKLENIS